MDTPDDAAADGARPARIGVVDDHEMMRMGVRIALGALPEVDVVAEASTVDELLATGEPLDLVLLDLSLQDGSLPEDNARRLDALGVPCVAYTSGEDAFLVQSAARGGVLAILDKSSTRDELLQGVLDAVAGRPVFTAGWAAAIDADPVLDAIELSGRQRQVLELFASGEPAKRVASRTGLSQATVNDYLLRIRAKYAAQGREASTKVALYQRALEDGVLPVPRRPRPEQR